MTVISRAARRAARRSLWTRARIPVPWGCAQNLEQGTWNRTLRTGHCILETKTWKLGPLGTGNQELGTRNWELGTRNWELWEPGTTIAGKELGTRKSGNCRELGIIAVNWEPGIGRKLGTRNWEPGTRNWEPGTALLTTLPVSGTKNSNRELGCDRMGQCSAVGFVAPQVF